MSEKCLSHRNSLPLDKGLCGEAGTGAGRDRNWRRGRQNSHADVNDDGQHTKGGCEVTTS
jgi:hypothetical protein